MPRSVARRRASSRAAAVEPAIPQPQPRSSVRSPAMAWSGCSPKASAPAESSAESGVAPLTWPTNRARPATAAAAISISESGTHRRMASPAGCSPRPVGPSIRWPARRSAAASARPARPRPTTPTRRGSALADGCRLVSSAAIRSSSRMGYRSVVGKIRVRSTGVAAELKVTLGAVSSSTKDERREELLALYHTVGACRECPLGSLRTNAVVGMGNADADLMFVGEAPGAEEDRQGKPFVGRAGKLLDDLLGEIGMERKRDAFICNVLKSRPPGNRDPQPEEIDACKPYLMRQIQLIQPKVICTLGNFATKLITQSPTGITRCCGRPQEREVAGLSLTIYPLFHPASALRTPSVLAKLREDFARIPELLAAGAREA